MLKRGPSAARDGEAIGGVDDRARVVVTHDTGNYLGCIESIWAALSIDEGGEGICAAPFGDMTLRLSLPIVVVLT